MVKAEIEKLGCFAAEFNTIAIDDGIAMGHDGMLYSLPSRDLIADSVEYMINAHKADAMVCISNCDKITPGMLMAAMRLNIPTVFISGGPMEAGKIGDEQVDLIDAMIESADDSVSDERIAQLENLACPTCGSCSGMFTANSMNCLAEAIGLALPGNGTIVATHVNRKELFVKAAKQIVENANRYYFDGDESILPRNIATREAFLNAMTLDIAMGVYKYYSTLACHCSRGRSIVHTRRYRCLVAKSSLHLQSSTQHQEISHSGRQSSRRNFGNHERTGRGRTRRFVGSPC